jgi:hypothetical protein
MGIKKVPCTPVFHCSKPFQIFYHSKIMKILYLPWLQSGYHTVQLEYERFHAFSIIFRIAIEREKLSSLTVDVPRAGILWIWISVCNGTGIYNLMNSLGCKRAELDCVAHCHWSTKSNMKAKSLLGDSKFASARFGYFLLLEMQSLYVSDFLYIVGWILKNGDMTQSKF